MTNSTAKVTINTLTNTQLQHKADISSTLSEVLYTHEYHTLCSFYGHRLTTRTQSHDNNTVTHVCARTHIHTHTLRNWLHQSTVHVRQTTTLQVHSCNHSKQWTLVILVTTPLTSLTMTITVSLITKAVNIYASLHARCLLFLSNFNQTSTFYTDLFLELPKTKFHENLCSGSETDRQTWQS